MRDQCEFSSVTKAYLSRFSEILSVMIENMTGAELNDSLSHNFIKQMIPHHMAAIEMSENILRYTTCVPLENIARDIIEEQTRSIAQMKDILEGCDSFSNSERDICVYQRNYRDITETMFTRMHNACRTNDINGDFLREMIPHHEGAVMMSENILRYEICPGLVPIARAICVSQRQGIRQMECLLSRI